MLMRGGTKGAVSLEVVAMIHRAQECTLGIVHAVCLLAMHVVVESSRWLVASMAAACGAVLSMIAREIWACFEASTFLAR